MHVIIDGKIRQEPSFKKEEKFSSDSHGRYPYEVYYIGDIQISDSHDGTFHLSIDDITGNVPVQIPEEMIVGFSIMSGLDRVHRTRGIYKLGGATAVVEGTDAGMVTVTGTSIEDVRNLYCKIRVGDILPEPKDNWDAEQIKPSFVRNLRIGLHNLFSR